MGTSYPIAITLIEKLRGIQADTSIQIRKVLSKKVARGEVCFLITYRLISEYI